MSETFDKISATLDAAVEPVPPAGGEVEVLGYYVQRGNSNHYRDTPAEGRGTKCTPLVDRAHVTRLQAEVARLGRVEGQSREALQVANHLAKQVIAERDALKAELTGYSHHHEVVRERDDLEAELMEVEKERDDLKAEVEQLKGEQP